MYFFPLLFLTAAAVAFLFWLLGKTNLPQWGRLALSLLMGVLFALVLSWVMLYLSILAFQMNDPITM